MSRMLRRRIRRALRLDRWIDARGGQGPVFDLDVVHRAFKQSLLVARLYRRPARYLRGRSGAARQARGH